MSKEIYKFLRKPILGIYFKEAYIRLEKNEIMKTSRL